VTATFTYDQAVLEAFPAIRAAVVSIHGIERGEAVGLLGEYRDAQLETLNRLTATPIAQVPSVGAWRRAFTQFGVKPTQYRSAVEALLRRLSKTGDVPSINPLVDIGNLVSIRHALPVAVFDLDMVSPPITVRFATGEEVFRGIGTETADHPTPGEVVFVDSAGSVCARRWCWRQSADSAAGKSSTAALFVTEGHHESAADDVQAAANDIVDLATSHLHGVVQEFELLP